MEGRVEGEGQGRHRWGGDRSAALRATSPTKQTLGKRAPAAPPGGARARKQAQMVPAGLCTWMGATSCGSGTKVDCTGLAQMESLVEAEYSCSADPMPYSSFVTLTRSTTSLADQLRLTK